MLCFYETVRSGLVPCRIVAYDLKNGQPETFKLEVTAHRPGYRRGEQIEATRLHCLPRHAVYRPRGCFAQRILPYRWTHHGPLSSGDLNVQVGSSQCGLAAESGATVNA